MKDIDLSAYCVMFTNFLKSINYFSANIYSGISNNKEVMYIRERYL